MINNIVFCATRKELSEVDLTSLRMEGVTSTQFLSEAIQLLMETDVNTFVLSSVAVEEQSTEDKFIEDLKILYSLKKRLRIIYIKPNIQMDKVILLMDEKNNWDVHYNTKIENLQPDVFVRMIQDIKKPTKENLHMKLKETSNEVSINADFFATKVLETKSSTIPLTENMEFNTLLRLNSPFVMDLSLGYKNMKEDLNELKKEYSDYIKRYTIQSNELTIVKERMTKVDMLNSKLHEDNSELKRSLHIIQSKFNKLVEKLDGIVNISNLDTLFTEQLSIDEYANKAPVIIYFKEYSKVNYFTDFIVHFNALLNNTMGLSKVLIIEEDEKRFKFPLYQEKNFVEVFDGENMGKVVLANLVSFGNNLKLNKYLLLNSLRLDFLIVVDRTNHYEDILVGDNVIKFDLTSNEEEYKLLGLNSLVITNDKESKYCLEEIKEFNKIKNDYELVHSAIISLDLTKKLSQFIISWQEVNTRREGGR